MMIKICYYTILLTFISLSSTAQQLPVSRSVEQAYTKGTRDKTGAPGRKYWQNRGDYDMKIKFDPQSRALAGTVGIDYTNNSPDTLKTLVFKLYPNLYKADAMRNTVVAPADLGDGVRISSLKIDGQTIDSAKRVARGTNMSVKGTTVLPGQKIHINIAYNYTLNKTSFIRTGQIDSGAFFIAYFFPRLTVYDDTDGWNLYPYIGKEEFYNDYGNFKVSVTVPGNYQVWATGDLMNTGDVYEPEFAKRIKQAEQSDSVTDVISVEDLKAGHITRNKPVNTWQFEANNVIDFAFAISNHYVWKASSIVVDLTTNSRTWVDAVFNPDHKTYLPVVGYSRKTVDLISHYFPAIPFPYPHETIFDGLDAMEYPMMVNNLPFKDKSDVIEFTSHEVFHSLFPFYVGTNETKYSFMDEGWATMTEFLFYPLIDPKGKAGYDLSPINDSAGTDEDVPVITLTPQLYGKARFADKDLKPAIALYYLKEMLGEQLFLKAMRHYINTWAGKHPTPYDFFNCMNTGAGINLNWFWKNWFFEKNVPDLAIAKVIKQGTDYTVTVTSPGTLAVPIHLSAIYDDGSTQTIEKNVGCWMTGAKTVALKFKAKARVTELILGGAYDVDVNPVNNHWKPGGGEPKDR